MGGKEKKKKAMDLVASAQINAENFLEMLLTYSLAC